MNKVKKSISYLNEPEIRPIKVTQNSLNSLLQTYQKMKLTMHTYT